MHLWRALLTLDCLLHWVVDVDINQVAKYVHVDQVCVRVDAHCLEDHGVSSIYLCLNLGVFVVVSDALVFVHGDAVFAIEGRRVEELIFERDQGAEVDTLGRPRAHPNSMRQQRVN